MEVGDWNGGIERPGMRAFIPFKTPFLARRRWQMAVVVVHKLWGGSLEPTKPGVGGIERRGGESRS